MKNKKLYPFLITVLFALGLPVLVALTGCSGDDFEIEPVGDAGADVADAAKDAPAQDAKGDSAKDSASDIGADVADAPSQTETDIEAGTEAGEEASLPDGAVALSPGDLIKGSDQATYYYGNDLKRHLFPNEKTFSSWFTADDMSLVKTVPDAQLSQIAEGSHVTVRPGTWLVKITSDPKTYAITNCATLHWIESEAIMASLYGTDWATRIIDVPDAFFGDYKVGTSISAPVHPDGTLIKYPGLADRYVVVSGQKRKIATQAAFEANKWQDIFVLETAVPYGDGPDVTSNEPQNFWQIGCTP